MSETQRYEVATSVEALASAWARTGNAPDGGIRGGTPWRESGDEALMMAMVIRPSIDPLQEALLWLVASIGAADALAELTGTGHELIWPDTVSQASPPTNANAAEAGHGSARSVVNVTVQLGPGRIEHAVLAVRTHLDGLDITKDVLLASLGRHLLLATRMVESDSLALLEAFSDQSALARFAVAARRGPRAGNRCRRGWVSCARVFDRHARTNCARITAFADAPGLSAPTDYM